MHADVGAVNNRCKRGGQVSGMLMLRYLSMVLKRLLSAPPLSPEAPKQQLCYGHHIQNAPFFLHFSSSSTSSYLTILRTKGFCFKDCEPACTNEACLSVYLNRDGHVGRRAVFLAG